MHVLSAENIRPLLALQDNYIWVWWNTSLNQLVVIDPGQAAPVITFLKQHGLTLAAILITHHHADHSAGIGELLDYAGPVPVIGGENSPLKSLTHRVMEGDSLAFLSLPLTVLQIPGHTHDHIAYVGKQILFCGDTLFSAGCGRIFEGMPTQMLHSLNKLQQLDDNTRIYCGHEYTFSNLQFANHVDPHNPDIAARIDEVKHRLQKGESTLPSLLSDEKKINPFLRCEHRAIITAVENYKHCLLQNPVEVFAALREWKNNFVSHSEF